MSILPWLLLLAALAPAQTRQPAPMNDSIRREQLEADLHFLASDALKGRLTGDPEYYLSASFIEARFRHLGLQPVGDSFRQTFSLTYARLDTGNRLRVHATSGLTSGGRVLEDFYPLFFSPTAQAKGHVVFAGFGIRAPKIAWDDLGSASINGRVALILAGEPEPNDPKSRFDGLVTSMYSDPMRKSLDLQERGAIGVLIVGASDEDRSIGPSAKGYWPEKPAHLERYALTPWAERLRIPVMQVSGAVAQSILGDRKLSQVAKDAERSGGFQALSLPGVEIEVETALRRHVITDQNIVAKVEGADPQLRDEAVIVSAHYDHNGAEGGLIYNGADDNGSGTVGLLDIAEAYALAVKQGQRPRRTVIFVAWGSEERCCGPLLGAWAWNEKPRWPLDKTVAVLNMDMIGRSEEVPETGGGRFNGLAPQTAASNATAVNVIGTSFSPSLRDAAREANRWTDMQLRFRYDNNKSNLLRRSDHWVFLQYGVPGLWFHTGLHPDYHTQFDRPERIDYKKMERVARLVHQLSWDLAMSDHKPDRAKRTAMPPVD
ncbi:MAG: M28 family peptidase [Bryobacteraceae bacterium]